MCEALNARHDAYMAAHPIPKGPLPEGPLMDLEEYTRRLLAGEFFPIEWEATTIRGDSMTQPKWLTDLRAALAGSGVLADAQRALREAVVAAQSIPGQPIPEDEEPDEPTK